MPAHTNSIAHNSRYLVGLGHAGGKASDGRHPLLADLHGVDSTALSMLPGYDRPAPERGANMKRGRASSRDAGLGTVDGDGGSATCRRASRCKWRSTRRTMGMAITAVAHSAHFGAPYYTLMAAKGG